MAKDYRLSQKDFEAINRAAMEAGSLVKGLAASREKIWKLRFLLGHASHGRCRSNADQALAELEEWLDRRSPGFRISDYPDLT